MKMVEAVRMPRMRHAKNLPQPQAASACHRHHKEAVKESSILTTKTERHKGTKAQRHKEKVLSSQFSPTLRH
jgi:hypothetical protein